MNNLDLTKDEMCLLEVMLNRAMRYTENTNLGIDQKIEDIDFCKEIIERLQKFV